MGRFVRRRARGRDWVAWLPDRFTLDELVAAAGMHEVRGALGWLYEAIEGGRILPVRVGVRLSYDFVGQRRAGDARRTGDVTRPNA